MWCKIPISGDRFKLLRLVYKFTLSFERRHMGRCKERNDLRHIQFDFARNFQLFIRILRPAFTLQFFLQSMSHHDCGGVKNRRQCEVHGSMSSEQDEWDIYFKTTTVFVICDFCDVSSLLEMPKKHCGRELRMTCDEKRAAFALFAGGRSKLTSSVVQSCMKYAMYWESALGLIELLADITSAAAQNNKSLAPNVNKLRNKSNEKKNRLLNNCDVITNFMRSTDSPCTRHSTLGCDKSTREFMMPNDEMFFRGWMELWKSEKNDPSDYRSSTSVPLDVFSAQRAVGWGVRRKSICNLFVDRIHVD